MYDRFAQTKYSDFPPAASLSDRLKVQFSQLNIFPVGTLSFFVLAGIGKLWNASWNEYIPIYPQFWTYFHSAGAGQSG